LQLRLALPLSVPGPAGPGQSRHEQHDIGVFPGRPGSAGHPVPCAADGTRERLLAQAIALACAAISWGIGLLRSN